MNGFIEWLEGLNEKDTRVRAVLRRSLCLRSRKIRTCLSLRRALR